MSRRTIREAREGEGYGGGKVERKKRKKRAAFFFRDLGGHGASSFLYQPPLSLLFHAGSLSFSSANFERITVNQLNTSGADVARSKMNLVSVSYLYTCIGTFDPSLE